MALLDAGSTDQSNCLGVLFDPDLQIDKDWDEVTNRVRVNLTQKWAERKVSIKGQAEVVNASIIISCLTIVPCPGY